MYEKESFLAFHIGKQMTLLAVPRKNDFKSRNNEIFFALKSANIFCLLTLTPKDISMILRFFEIE